MHPSTDSAASSCRPCQQDRSRQLLVPALPSRAPPFHDVVRYHASMAKTASTAPLPRTRHASRPNPPPKASRSEDNCRRTCPVQVRETDNINQLATWPRAAPAVFLFRWQHGPRSDPLDDGGSNRTVHAEVTRATKVKRCRTNQTYK
jgi:hypothetical protein